MKKEKREGSESALTAMLRQETVPTWQQKLGVVWQLSVPAILAQITFIMLQYIDTAMVGHLGANASASIGVVSTSTWLLSGLCSAVATGFSVQVAALIGAGNDKKARQVLKHSIVTALIFSLVLAGVSAALSFPLPRWLGAAEVVQKDATRYFFIFALFLPALQINSLAGMMLQNSGDMRTPAWLDAAMCGLDVGFNFIFIRYWGVAGAALGTALAEAVICIIKLYVVSCKSPLLHLKRKEACPYDKNILRKMLRIGVPMAFEHTAICGAMILVTTFITSLGTVPMAAHSIAVTAESVCYMPGYGIAAAATLLTGQSFGAKKEALGKSFSDLAILLGCAVMTLAAVLVYFICPFIFSILTPDKEVQLLAARALRIQLLAEPLYAVAIVASGSLRGIGDTLIPSILNLISLWGVRITLAFLLVRQWGLPGVWFAMGAELCVRGLLMLFRQQTKLRPPETMPTLVYEGIGLENEQKIEK